MSWRNCASIVWVPKFCVMVYASVAIPCALVIAVPTGKSFTLNSTVLPSIGKLFSVSVNVAIKFTVSPLNPFTGFVTIAVGMC